MKHTSFYLILLVLAGMAGPAAAQEIAGRIFDEKQQPVSAVIQVRQGQVLKGGDVADADGNYDVKPLDPGYYDVVVTYPSYDTIIVTGVVVTPGEKTTQNFNMRPLRQLHSYKCVEVVAFKKPLIDHDRTATTLTRDEIATLPTSQVTDLVSLSPGVYESQQGGVINGNTTGNYARINENDYRNVVANPVSTMSVDVDRASYANVRRFINEGTMPPPDAVRIEEMVNYFNYSYPQPEGSDPISINTELTPCPWQKDHALLRVGIQAKTLDRGKLPPSNLVFLIDVSGSMWSPERLPLLVAGMKLLVNELRPEDKVAIVTYAGNAGLALPPTSGGDKTTILNALDQLVAGGSTAGGEGITLAYKIAKENFIKGGNNRILLATDGDFNVGISSDNDLEALITKERETGISLTCLGFGTDNFKDAKMEMLADKGNGNYDYIDNLQEAQKMLVTEFGGTLYMVAKDVKAQIEFNPDKVQGYRLIGYEDRLLNTEDFKNDKKDAGDMGSGHTVTILYELVPAGDSSLPAADRLKYQHTASTGSNDLATIKFRYKAPADSTSKEIIDVIPSDVTPPGDATASTRFAASVTMFGMLLRNSQYKGTASYDDVISLAEQSKEHDLDGYKAEFVRLVKATKQLGVTIGAK